MFKLGKFYSIMSTSSKIMYEKMIRERSDIDYNFYLQIIKIETF